MFGRLSARIQELMAEGEAYDKWATAASTQNLYGRMWKAFEAWCSEQEVDALPTHPEIIAVYITDLARRLRPSSIGVHLAALKYAHTQAGHLSPTDDPIVRRRMAGIRRAKGTAITQKTPLVLDDLDKAIDHLGERTRAIRDKALFMLTWAAGLRRSEAVGLDLEPGGDGTGYIRFTAQGIEVVITKSKTDQEGSGYVIAIPVRKWTPAKCPVRLLRAWLDSAAITDGPLFRGVTQGGIISTTRLRAAAIADSVKKAVKRIGLDHRTYSGHSLRAGFVTSSSQAGAPVAALQATTRHKQVDTLFGYVRSVRKYDESALRYIPSW